MLARYNHYNPVTKELAAGQAEKAAYAYFTSVPADYTAINTIDNWHLYGNDVFDYMRCTDEIDLIFQAKTGATEADKWANCTPSEQDCLAARQLVGKSLRLQRYTAAEDETNFFYHAKRSMQSRQARIEIAELKIGYQIESKVDRDDLFGEVFSRIASFVNTNDPDLRDWMKSVGSYVGGGLQAKSYYVASIDPIFTAIVENGEY